MAFDHLPPSKPAPRRAKKDLIFCAGWHAFVHWPQLTGETAAPVPLLDANGQPLANDLIDGQEVEIVSWRPRSREGLVYQVRRITDDTEWRIGAAYLRRQRLAGEPSSPASPAAAVR